MGKKLLMFTHDFPMNHGDTAFLSSEMDILSSRFDKITIFCTSSDDKTRAFLPDNCSVYFVEKETRIKRIIRLLFSAVLWKNIFFLREEFKDKKASHKSNIADLDILHFFFRAILYCDRLKEVIHKEGEPDVIYSFWSDAEVLSAIIINGRVPIVTRVHGYDLYEERRKSLYQPFKKVMDRRLDAVFFISKQGMKYYRDRFDANHLTEYVLCYLGTKGANDSYISHPITNVIKLLSISAVVPIKRVELIVEMLSLVNPDIHINWTHIGGGPELARVKDLAYQKLERMENVSYSFMGFMKHDDVLSYLNANKFHFFVNTSSTEGLPVSMMEALSYSIPIIGTDVGGVSEIVDETDGFILQKDAEPQEYAKTIETIHLMPPDSYNELRRGAFEKWQNCFNASKNYKELADKLLNIADKQAKRSF